MSEQENVTTASENKTIDNSKDKTNGLANGGMPDLNMIKSGGRFLVTRVGENTKVVLTGDIEQIDNVYLDEKSNGLVYAVEKFKHHDLAGHIILKKGERSKVATLAAKIL